MIDTEAIRLLRHIIGNNVAHAKIYHDGKSRRTAEQVHEIQGRVVSNLETQLGERNITDQGAWEILKVLKEYDWRDAKSYSTFREAYDAYVAPVEKEVRALRDELFKNS